MAGQINEGEVMNQVSAIFKWCESLKRVTYSHFQNQIKQEMTVAYLQEFYQTVRDKCFKACVTKPSSSLSSSEQQCMAKCCDRYAEATSIVTKAVVEMSGLE
jgi:mitochondrial import inner membrane translocase subunit TIM13